TPQPVRRRLFTNLSAEQLDGQNDQAKNEDQQADPVDAVHITHPFCLWPLGILLTEIEVFRQLFQYAHKIAGSIAKLNKPDGNWCCQLLKNIFSHWSCMAE